MATASSTASSPSSSPRQGASPASLQSLRKSPTVTESGVKSAELENIQCGEKVTKKCFSIQSILARPEPLRPSEHPLSYAQILQANFANYMPPKYLGNGMIFPWMTRMSPDMPENLSTRSFIPAQVLKNRHMDTQKSPTSTPAKAEKAVFANGKSDVQSAGSRSPSPCASFDEDDDNCKSPSSPNSNSRRKKTRTVFSRNQVFQLESMFDMKRYLSSSERASLASSLNLSEQQIKIWFQNRRNKWKRQLCSDLDTNSISHGAPRFPPHLSLPMYSFPSSISNNSVSGENNSPHSQAQAAGLMQNLFCPGAMHPLFMGGHLPFSRPTV